MIDPFIENGHVEKSEFAEKRERERDNDMLSTSKDR